MHRRNRSQPPPFGLGSKAGIFHNRQPTAIEIGSFPVPLFQGIHKPAGDRRQWENGWGWSHCLNREELQCPSVQAQRPTPPAERCDYLYFRPDFTATDPNRLILIDKPENHGGQYRNRGYAAGHAEPDTVDDQGPIW